MKKKKKELRKDVLHWKLDWRIVHCGTRGHRTGPTDPVPSEVTHLSGHLRREEREVTGGKNSFPAGRICCFHKARPGALPVCPDRKLSTIFSLTFEVMCVWLLGSAFKIAKWKCTFELCVFFWLFYQEKDFTHTKWKFLTLGCYILTFIILIQYYLLIQENKRLKNSQ